MVSVPRWASVSSSIASDRYMEQHYHSLFASRAATSMRPTFEGLTAESMSPPLTFGRRHAAADMTAYDRLSFTADSY